MKVILAVNQEVLYFSGVTGKTFSFADGFELEAGSYAKENHGGNDIQVECNNLIMQPGHNNHLVSNKSMIIIGNTILYLHDDIKIRDNLNNEEDSSK